MPHEYDDRINFFDVMMECKLRPLGATLEKGSKVQGLTMWFVPFLYLENVVIFLTTSIITTSMIHCEVRNAALNFDHIQMLQKGGYPPKGDSRMTFVVLIYVV